MRYVEPLSDARTMLGDFFTIRLMVAVQKFRMRMLVVEFREVAVDGVGMAAFGFQLNGQMFNLEFTGHPASDRLEKVGCEGLVAAVDLHVGGHHDKSRFDGPDVQVMDVLHAGDGFDGGRHERRADAGRGGLQEDLK